jgi:anti-anti-sigma factor
MLSAVAGGIIAASVTARARNETVTMDSTRREIESDLLVIRVTETAERVDVHLIGEVDLGNSHELSAVLLEAVDIGKPRIRCNLRLLHYIDSSGVRALLQTAARAERSGGSLDVICAPGPVQRILELCNAPHRIVPGLTAAG